MLRKRIAAILITAAVCSSMVAEAGAAAFTTEEAATAAFGDGTFTDDTQQAVPETNETVTTPTVPETTVIPTVTVAPTVSEEVSEDESSDFTSEFTSEEVVMEFQDNAAVSEESEIVEEILDEAASAAVSVTVLETAWQAVMVNEVKRFRLAKPSVEKAAATELDFAVADELAEEVVAESDAVGTGEEVQEPVEMAGAGSTYFTSEDGIVTVTTQTASGNRTGQYLFDKDGYMITGEVEVQPGTLGYGYSEAETLYFREAEMSTAYADATVLTPANSTLGQQVKGEWIWNAKQGLFKHYATNGKFVSISEFVESLGSNYTGFFKINGEYYCLDNDGKPFVGYKRINKKLFYLQTAEEGKDIPGKLFRNGWRKTDDTKGTKWEYSHPSASADYALGQIREETGFYIVKAGDSRIYLLNKYNYVLKNKRARAIDGYTYGSDSRGCIYKDKLVKYNGYRYYFDANGRQARWRNSWRRIASYNRYFYFGNTAGMVQEKTGWQKIYVSGKPQWFYFPSTGNHYVNRWVGYRYFTSTGALASGLTKVGNSYYFFEASTAKQYKGIKIRNTLIKYNNNWYYAQGTGELLKSGWKKINGYYYYFSGFKAKTKTFQKLNGKYGYLDSTGKYRTGWVIISNALNKVKYVDSVNGKFYANTNVVIDGYRYYFDAQGYRINDLTNIYKGPYYVRVDKTNGVMTIFDAATRSVPVKSIRVSVGAPISLTPNGSYTLRRAGRWQSLMGPSWGQYGTHVSGAGRGGIFVHSIACSAANSYNLPVAEYNKLGNPASHGCIRCCVADAKWVYDNCNGATINIYEGSYKADEAMKGPLGRRRLEPLRAPYNFDPTDPAVR